MLPKPNRVQKVARVISDPIVNFVSLVSHAATQTPFKVIKSDDNSIMDETAKELLLGKSASVISVDITRPVPTAVMAQKVEFDTANFDQVRAQKMLKDLGFTDYTFEHTDTMLVAKSLHHDEFDQDNIGRIDGNVPGMRMFVGTTVTKSEEATVAAKSVVIDESRVPLIKGLGIKEIVQKYDYYAAWWSEATNLGEVLREGMEDGTPPGAFEVGDAFWKVVANCVKQNDMAGITKAAMDMASLLIALTNMFTSLTKSQDEGIKKMAQDALENLTKTEEVETVTDATTTAAENAEVVAETEAVATEESTVTDELATVETEEATATEEVEAPAEVVATEAVVEQKSAIDVVAAVENLLKGFKDEITTTFAESATNLEARIQKLEGTSTQKRSVESTVEESKIPGATTPVSSEPRLLKVDPRISAILGI